MPVIVQTGRKPRVVSQGPVLPSWDTPDEKIIVASDAGATDNFGLAQTTEGAAAGSVFLTRNEQYLFVSAVNNDVTETDQGRVYVFERGCIDGEWTEIQIIDEPETPIFSQRLGTNLAASYDGTHLLIGTSAAKFHYFKRVGSPGLWVHQQTIDDHEATPKSFGQTVDISDDGTVAILGNQGFDGGATSSGKAYIFNRDDAGSPGPWSLTQDLNTPTPITNGRFGGNFALAPDGTHLIIGQPEQAAQQGQAFVFDNTSGSPPGEWTHTQTLSGSVAHSNRRFGRGKISMSADGNTAVIPAAHLTVDATSFVGGGFVYTRSGGTWTEQQVIDPSDATSFSFGILGDWSSMAISNSGNTIVGGAANQTTGGQASNGAVYIWSGAIGSQTQQVKLLPSTAESGQYFGRSVAMRADNELFAAGHGRSVTAGDQGVVYQITTFPVVACGSPPI